MTGSIYDIEAPNFISRGEWVLTEQPIIGYICPDTKMPIRTITISAVCNYHKSTSLDEHRTIIRDFLLNIVPRPYGLSLDSYVPCTENQRLSVQIEFDPKELIDPTQTIKMKIINGLKELINDEDYSARVNEDYE